MIRSAKKTGKTLLALVTGFVVSFGATLVLSTPPEGPVSYDCAACHESCIEAGYASAYCTRTSCYCFS